MLSSIAGTGWSVCKQLCCLQGPDGGSGVTGATPDSVAAGAAPAGVIAEVSFMIVCKHLLHCPHMMCSLPTKDLLLQAAGEDLAAEFVSTMAPTERRRKKAHKPAATPLTGVPCHSSGLRCPLLKDSALSSWSPDHLCNMLPDAETQPGATVVKATAVWPAGATRRAPSRPSRKQPVQQQPELSEESAASGSEDSAASGSKSDRKDGAEVV